VSTDRDLERIVRSWLDEGVTVLPDRVLDAVLEQVPATPQHRLLWPVQRILTMNTYARVGLAAATVVLAAVIGIGLFGRSVGGPPPGPTPSSTPPAQATCQSNVSTGVLPDWARAGFTAAQPSMPYEIGRSGEIAAIIFGDPLTAPPPTNHGNKILWVARHPTAAARLDISAQRMDGEARVGDPVKQSVVGGPGPSLVDLPAPGCWRFTLRWADQTDTLDLEYIGVAG
jgi:hypothetical protein